MPLQITKKTIPLRSLNVSIQDVRRIVERLLPHVDDEGHREVTLLLENGPNNQERRELLEAQREQAFRITVTIYGRDGESLFGYGTEPFESPNIPEPIDSIYISNTAAYQTVTGNTPLNNFSINLDFSTPPLIDNNNPVSNPTPNYSNFTVEGTREAWIALIHQAVMEILAKKLNKRKFMHAAFVYDMGLFLFGLPSALYVCWRISEFVEINVGAISPFISAATYIYIVFLVLIFYRALFGYTKWAFPIVELTSNESRSKLHRKFWFTILGSLAASAIYDLFR